MIDDIDIWILVDTGADANAKEESITTPYKRHRRVVTRRLYSRVKVYSLHLLPNQHSDLELRIKNVRYCYHGPKNGKSTIN